MGFAVDQGLYSEAELSLLPELALNLSRGCGNPTGFAHLQRGEAVVDLGCGGGIDVILAAHKVGTQGRVVGIDFTPQMIERARETVATADLRDRSIELRRVEDMAETTLPDGSADVVISNCVINLCPDKDAVYREAFRVLRPGGRVAISDVVLSGDLATELRARLRSTWSGCLGGAIPEGEYLDTVRQAGFAEIQLVAHHPFSPDELQAMARCPGEAFTPAPSTDDLDAVQGKVTSIKFTALKPLASSGEEVTPGRATTASTMDEDLRPRELVASALVEAERGIADAEVRLTALEAEADELRSLVVRLEVERADLRQLEISERAPPAAEESGIKSEGEPCEVTGEVTGIETEGEPCEVTGEEPGIETEGEPGEVTGIKAEGEPGEVTAEIAAAGEPEAPARAAELGARQLAESGTATIAITLPPVGSVRVQWNFRAENSRR